MYKLSETAYQQYKNSVNGRENVTLEKAEKILNRNIILADIFINKYRKRAYYGKLCIIFDDVEKVITCIKNKTNHNGKVDKLKKKLLNEIMNIGE